MELNSERNTSLLRTPGAQTGETMDKFMKRVSPKEPQDLVASPQEEDTNQVTYADIVKATIIPAPDETGLASTQV